MNLGARGAIVGGLSARDYVQDDLVAMWDAIENAGWGTHDSGATKWKDLVGSNDWTLSSAIVWYEKYLKTPNAVCGLLSKATPSYNTIELVISKPDNGFIYNAVFYSGLDSSHVALCNNTAAINFAMNKYMTGFPKENGTAVATYTGKDIDGWYFDGENNVVYATDAWGYPPSVGVLGGRYASMGDTRNAYKGKIYAIRLYSDKLTADEIAANYAIDKARFGLT